jgi:hypothetical protein
MLQDQPFVINAVPKSLAQLVGDWDYLGHISSHISSLTVNK